MGQVYSQSSGCDLYEEEQGFWGVWEQPSMRSSRLVSRSPFPAQGSSGTPSTWPGRRRAPLTGLRAYPQHSLQPASAQVPESTCLIALI